MTGSPSVTQLNANFEETQALLVAARDYVAQFQQDDARGLDPEEKLTLSLESLRITTRLTNVMAWLLVQKAVQAGEMTMVEAAGRDHALGGHDLCLEEGEIEQPYIPDIMRELSIRSRHLFMRIDRLDRQQRRENAFDPPPRAHKPEDDAPGDAPTGTDPGVGPVDPPANEVEAEPLRKVAQGSDRVVWLASHRKRPGSGDPDPSAG